MFVRRPGSYRDVDRKARAEIIQAFAAMRLGIVVGSIPAAVQSVPRLAQCNKMKN